MELELIESICRLAVIFFVFFVSLLAGIITAKVFP
jgi:hypothetical protein